MTKILNKKSQKYDCFDDNLCIQICRQATEESRHKSSITTAPQRLLVNKTGAEIQGHTYITQGFIVFFFTLIHESLELRLIK